LSDLFEVLGVVDLDVNTELHSEFVEVHVEASDLGVLDSHGHLLGDSVALGGVTLDESGLQRGLSVALGDLNRLQGVFIFTGRADDLDGGHGIDDEFAEECAFAIGIKNFP
jgi:hypothetical protein